MKNANNMKIQKNYIKKQGTVKTQKMKHKIYILTPELYHQVKKIDKKLYICETHKYLYKNDFPCQAVCHKKGFRSYTR